MAIIPSDHISTLGPYCFLVTTSGAIQYGVPTIVDLLFCSGVICAQKPKSAAEGRREERGREDSGKKGGRKEKRKEEMIVREMNFK